MAVLIQALIFLLSVVFQTFSIVLLLRLILQKQHARWNNRVVQLTVSLTQWLVRPCRYIVPGYRGFDLSIVLLLWLIQWVLLLLMYALGSVVVSQIWVLLLQAAVAVMQLVLNFYSMVLLISAVISWFSSNQNSEIRYILNLLSGPLLSRIRRFVPLLYGIDFFTMGWHNFFEVGGDNSFGLFKSGCCDDLIDN